MTALRKRPCAKCPYRRTVPIYLTLGRRVSLVQSLVEGNWFPCHETTVENDDGDLQATVESQHCAGAEAMLVKSGHSVTQLTRIAERLSGEEVDYEALGDLVWSTREFQTFAMGVTSDTAPDLPAEDEVETCNTVNDGCLAPAGYLMGGGVVHGTVAADGECPNCSDPVCSNCADAEGLCGMCSMESDG